MSNRKCFAGLAGLYLLLVCLLATIALLENGEKCPDACKIFAFDILTLNRCSHYALLSVPHAPRAYWEESEILGFTATIDYLLDPETACSDANDCSLTFHYLEFSFISNSTGLMGAYFHDLWLPINDVMHLYYALRE